MTNAQLLSMTHTILSVFLLGFFFAKLEIAVEGDAGWAENLPTWRIEGHWLLDIFIAKLIYRLGIIFSLIAQMAIMVGIIGLINFSLFQLMDQQ